MNTLTLTAAARVLAIAALTMGTTPATSWGGGEPPPTSFDEADLFFELNNTDRDLGIHANIDGAEWRRLVIKPPDGRPLLEVTAKGNLRKQGMTQLDFESAEPTFDELPPADFFDRFPAGDYRIKGRTVEGDDLENTATITHVMPAPPVFNSPPLAPCDNPVVVTAPVTISWQQVNSHHTGLGAMGAVVVDRYELAIERADLGIDFFLTLPPGITSFPVPSLFTNTPGVIKFEVLVKAAGGNRTAEESCFRIE